MNQENEHSILLCTREASELTQIAVSLVSYLDHSEYFPVWCDPLRACHFSKAITMVVLIFTSYFQQNI